MILLLSLSFSSMTVVVYKRHISNIKYLHCLVSNACLFESNEQLIDRAKPCRVSQKVCNVMLSDCFFLHHIRLTVILVLQNHWTLSNHRLKGKLTHTNTVHMNFLIHNWTVIFYWDKKRSFLFYFILILPNPYIPF